MALFSKFQTLPYSCKDYAHPWTHSCTDASAGIGVHAVQECLRIYITVYMLALVMRGQAPTRKYLKKTILGIIQSSAFLTCHAYSFLLFVCAVRKVLGNFNYFTVSFLPAFISSYVSIMIERPSRRGLLCLYVTNIASETLFRMAAKRGLVRHIPHGEVYIFMGSVATLLYFYRARRQNHDSVYSLLKFVVGPFEEYDYTENREDLPSHGAPIRSPTVERRELPPACTVSPRPWIILVLRRVVLRLVWPWLRVIKNQGRHRTCPHPFSCLYYTLQGAGKLFSVGYGLQACLTLLLRMRKLVKRPSLLPSLLFSKDAFELGAFLGGFSGIFRLTSCLLRRFFNKDSKFHAIPSGLFAGTTFYMYPNSTVALYMMWKTLQVVYNAGTAEGYFPELPWATILLYCFSTAVLFHAAVLEPRSLRPSYWKFLLSISGGRVGDINRSALEIYGHDSTMAFH